MKASKGGAPSIWTDAQTDMLCDLVADDVPFGVIAKHLDFTQRQCVDRFKTIRRRYGWQAA